MVLAGILAFATVSSGASAVDSDPNRPLVAPTFVQKPPVLDGTMSKGEWGRVASTTGFLYTDVNLAAMQSRVWTSFDEENLYICFQSYNPGGIDGAVKDRDEGDLFREDAVEIFLQPGGEGTYYQFGANSLDARFDSEGEIKSWNADWQSASGIVKDQWYVGGTWTIEIAIPFSALGDGGAPADGTTWRGKAGPMKTASAT